ncbi:hypothetical protein [Umezawaea sp. NPDC059074]|uniref:hypothetical protein n=1 Tax=Umezawaea sp. NPDC059074 TaxID=3346716 RepID=UPI0036AE4594
MKRTTYAVRGTSFTPPGQLPEGLSVQEMEHDVVDLVVIRSVAGTSVLAVREDATTSGRVLLELEMDEGDHEGVGSGLFDDAALRQLRDVLIARFGDGRPRRVLKDISGFRTEWRWFEAKPDLFTYQTTWAEAQAEARGDGDAAINWTLAQIRSENPGCQLVDVTNEHPEVNR